MPMISLDTFLMITPHGITGSSPGGRHSQAAADVRKKRHDFIAGAHRQKAAPRGEARFTALSRRTQKHADGTIISARRPRGLMPQPGRTSTSFAIITLIVRGRLPGTLSAAARRRLPRGLTHAAVSRPPGCRRDSPTTIFWPASPQQRLTLMTPLFRAKRRATSTARLRARLLMADSAEPAIAGCQETRCSY